MHPPAPELERAPPDRRANVPGILLVLGLASLWTGIIAIGIELEALPNRRRPLASWFPGGWFAAAGIGMSLFALARHLLRERPRGLRLLPRSPAFAIATGAAGLVLLFLHIGHFCAGGHAAHGLEEGWIVDGSAHFLLSISMLSVLGSPRGTIRYALSIGVAFLFVSAGALVIAPPLGMFAALVTWLFGLRPLLWEREFGLPAHEEWADRVLRDLDPPLR